MPIQKAILQQAMLNELQNQEPKHVQGYFYIDSKTKTSTPVEWPKQYYCTDARVLMDQFEAVVRHPGALADASYEELYLECLNWLSKGMQ